MRSQLVAFPLIRSSFWEVRISKSWFVFWQSLWREGMSLGTLVNSSFILAQDFSTELLHRDGQNSLE